jgi:alpha-tubulin suppressor-like RCC1 family protein
MNESMLEQEAGEFNGILGVRFWMLGTFPAFSGMRVSSGNPKQLMKQNRIVMYLGTLGASLGLATSTTSLMAEPTAGQLISWGGVVLPYVEPGTIYTNITAGGGMSAAVTSRGTVVAWGDNNYGASTPPADLSDVVALASGGPHSLALKSDGTVATWGYFWTGQLYVQNVAPPGLSNVVAVAASWDSSLALKSDGTVVLWGTNNVAGTPPPGLTNIVRIGAGGWQRMAVRADGAVFVWGVMVDSPPAGLTNVVALAAGWSHTLALRADGIVMVWGGNTDGQTNMPPGLSNVVAIAAGERHSLALKGDGTVVAWGSNPPSSDGGAGPCDVPAGLSNVVAIAAGQSHSLALRRDGTLVVWGSSEKGQRILPGSLTNIIAVAAGNQTLALRGDGTLVSWGMAVTAPPARLRKVTGIAAELAHLLALQDDGTVVSWGSNNYGQTNVPAGLSNVVAVAGARDHSLALRRDGTVVAWGANDAGQSSVPPDLSNAFAVSASIAWPQTAGNLVLTTAGAVTGWPTAAPELGTVTALATGSSPATGLAIRSDGTLAAWGDNTFGLTNLPPGLTNVCAAAIPWYHCLALKLDGTVSGWGTVLTNAVTLENADAVTVPLGASNVVAIAAGRAVSLAIRADPQITSISVTGSIAVIRFLTFAGRAYVVESCPDLVSGSWTPLPGGSIPGDGREASIADALVYESARFYRLRVSPSQ